MVIASFHPPAPRFSVRAASAMRADLAEEWGSLTANEVVDILMDKFQQRGPVTVLDIHLVGSE